MKKLVLTAGLVLITGLFLHAIQGIAQMGGGGMMGSGGMGSGMGGNSGMMGFGRPSDRQYGPDYQQQNPLREDDARSILENYLKSKGNPNLRLGQIKDKGNAFEGEILTRDDSLVDKILVDKNNGSLRSVY